jgi:hypothetical protein
MNIPLAPFKGGISKCTLHLPLDGQYLHPATSFLHSLFDIQILLYL